MSILIGDAYSGVRQGNMQQKTQTLNPTQTAALGPCNPTQLYFLNILKQPQKLKMLDTKNTG